MDQRTNSPAWAPWWIYVVVIVGANLLKQQLLQDQPVALNLAVTVVLVVVLFGLVTITFRALAGRRES